MSNDHKINWTKKLRDNLEFFDENYDTELESVVIAKPFDPTSFRLNYETTRVAMLEGYEQETLEYQEYLDRGGKDDQGLWRLHRFKVQYEGHEPRAGYECYAPTPEQIAYAEECTRDLRKMFGVDDPIEDEAPVEDEAPSREELEGTDVKPITEPLDIWGETFPVPELTRDMLPKVIADYAFDEAERIGIDPGCVAIPCLIVCAAALDDSIRVQPMRKNTRWTERACLWAGFVSPPSGRKTAGLESAREPMKLVERVWRKQDQIAMAEYMNALDDWKENAKTARKEGTVVPEEPIKPPMRRLYTSDYTMESLEDILIDNTRGILIYNDELIGFITGLDAYKASKGKDRSAALELFNGGDKPVDRKNNHRLVPNWSACVIGGIQDEKLKSVAPALSDDGMLQRFLLFRSGTPRAGVDSNPDMDAMADYVSMYQTLCTQLEDRVIKLSDEAHPWRELVFKSADALSIDKSLSPAFRTHVGKMRGMFSRLLLTIHAIEAHPNPIGLLISGETAKMAHDLIMKFFIPHELAIYADLFDSNYATGEDMRWIAGHVLAHQLTSFKERDIYRAKPEFLEDRHRLTAALKGLEELSWIERDGNTWNVDSRIHKANADRAAQEQRDRKDRQQQIILRRTMWKENQIES